MDVVGGRHAQVLARVLGTVVLTLVHAGGCSRGPVDVTGFLLTQSAKDLPDVDLFVCAGLGEHRESGLPTCEGEIARLKPPWIYRGDIELIDHQHLEPGSQEFWTLKPMKFVLLPGNAIALADE